MALYVERIATGVVASNDNVLFDNIALSDSNISYDDATGLVTFHSSGKYLINWWTTTQSSVSTTGAHFALKIDGGEPKIGASPIKTGEVVGCSIVTADEASTLSLVNDASDFYLSAIVPVKAAMTIVEINESAIATGGQVMLTQMSGGSLPPALAVPFDFLRITSGGVSFDAIQYGFVINEPGLYSANWWIGVTGVTVGVDISFDLNTGNYQFRGESPNTTGQIVGNALFEAQPGDIITLHNTSSGAVTVMNAVYQASMVLTKVC
ncbi:hypothetical protein [Clostridium minihomine]|uniref:hypothetical protein n=1 Tax=Clostridium minihomine TaxID=2045012 RepID=UPI000C7832F4|nr:hypothetical protein [Clostridium minihomine]